jgi:hypothetical protein
MFSDINPELVFHIKIYASIEKLGEVMRACGKTDCFRAFTIGVTRSAPFVSFVDVGEGKEMADSKIKGAYISISIWDMENEKITKTRPAQMALSQLQLQSHFPWRLARQRIRPPHYRASNEQYRAQAHSINRRDALRKGTSRAEICSIFSMGYNFCEYAIGRTNIAWD